MGGSHAGRPRVHVEGGNGRTSNGGAIHDGAIHDGTVTAGREPRLLGIYLNDHLAAATADLELARRTARVHRGTSTGGVLGRLTAEVAEDRAALIRIMMVLGVPIRGYKISAGWLAEKVGRLKPNGHLLRRSPMATVVELEGLRIGAESRILAWTTLLTAAEADDRLDAGMLDGLLERARRQVDEIDQLRLRAVGDLLGVS